MSVDSALSVLNERTKNKNPLYLDSLQHHGSGSGWKRVSSGWGLLVLVTTVAGYIVTVCDVSHILGRLIQPRTGGRIEAGGWRTLFLLRTHFGVVTGVALGQCS